MPIERLFIGCLLWLGGGLLLGARGHALGEGRLNGNFLATDVRHS